MSLWEALQAARAVGKWSAFRLPDGTYGIDPPKGEVK